MKMFIGLGLLCLSTFLDAMNLSPNNIIEIADDEHNSHISNNNNGPLSNYCSTYSRLNLPYDEFIIHTEDLKVHNNFHHISCTEEAIQIIRNVYSDNHHHDRLTVWPTTELAISAIYADHHKRLSILQLLTEEFPDFKKDHPFLVLKEAIKQFWYKDIFVPSRELARPLPAELMNPHLLPAEKKIIIEHFIWHFYNNSLETHTVNSHRKTKAKHIINSINKFTETVDAFNKEISNKIFCFTKQDYNWLTEFGLGIALTECFRGYKKFNETLFGNLCKQYPHLNIIKNRYLIKLATIRRFTLPTPDNLSADLQSIQQSAHRYPNLWPAHYSAFITNYQQQHSDQPSPFDDEYQKIDWLAHAKVRAAREATLEANDKDINSNNQHLDYFTDQEDSFNVNIPLQEISQELNPPAKKQKTHGKDEVSDDEVEVSGIGDSFGNSSMNITFGSPVLEYSSQEAGIDWPSLTEANIDYNQPGLKAMLGLDNAINPES